MNYKTLKCHLKLKLGGFVPRRRWVGVRTVTPLSEDLLIDSQMMSRSSLPGLSFRLVLAVDGVCVPGSSGGDPLPGRGCGFVPYLTPSLSRQGWEAISLFVSR